jgi:hypothetical protein
MVGRGDCKTKSTRATTFRALSGRRTYAAVGVALVGTKVAAIMLRLCSWPRSSPCPEAALHHGPVIYSDSTNERLLHDCGVSQRTCGLDKTAQLDPAPAALQGASIGSLSG